MASSDLEVPGGTPLRLVARAAGTSVDLPAPPPARRLLSQYVPDRGGSLTLHVPPRGVARANTMLPRLLTHWHPGDAEDRVDEGFDWGSEELRTTANAGRPPRALSLWDDPMGVGSPRRPPPAGGDLADADDAGDTPAAAAAEGETVLLFYRVDDGESLGAIARRFGIKTTRIVADNRLDPQAKLQKGMLLKLHVPRAALSRLASGRRWTTRSTPRRPFQARRRSRHGGRLHHRSAGAGDDTGAAA